MNLSQRAFDHSSNINKNQLVDQSLKVVSKAP